MKKSKKIETMSDFIEATKDFDIAKSLREFETPEMVAKRKAFFRTLKRK